MANLLSTGIYGFLCSLKKTATGYAEHFMTGFTGHGWKIWEYVKGKWMLEIDAIRVRGTMTVFELLISKIRAIKGAQVISQGCGKIKAVTLSDANAKVEYLITLEDKDMSFMEHDFIRCQVFNGGTIKLYHVEIASVTDNRVIHIDHSEFDYLTDEYGNTVVINPPEPSDEIVQFGNSSRDEKYIGRHSAIYMHADESGQPAIDVLFDIYTKDFGNCVKIRLGGDIPGEKNMKGFYCENGMIKCTVDGVVTYVLRPDGSGSIAGGAINWSFDKTTKKCICNLKDVVLQWDSLSDETKENLKGDKGENGDQGPRGLTGLQGSKGEQGIQGQAGKDGSTTYFHIKYSSIPNPTETNQMTETPSTYIGTYVDTIPSDSGDPYDYRWARFEGLQGGKGDQGIPGTDGEDGQTYYLHIKYSNDGGKTFTGNNGEDSGSWIGVCTDTNINDPGNVGAYKWSLIKGGDGKDANLLPWVEEWNTNANVVGPDYFISPKIFSGTRDANNKKLTGVALGRSVIEIDGIKKTGLFGIKDGELTFSIDALTGDVDFSGDLLAKIIKAHGLNIDDKFVVSTVNGITKVDIEGILRIPYTRLRWDGDEFADGASSNMVTVDEYNLSMVRLYELRLKNRSATRFDITSFQTTEYPVGAIMLPAETDSQFIGTEYEFTYYPIRTRVPIAPFFIGIQGDGSFVTSYVSNHIVPDRFNAILLDNAIDKYVSLSISIKGIPNELGNGVRWFIINKSEINNERTNLMSSVKYTPIEI